VYTPDRDAMLLEARRSLRLLEVIAADSSITQRGIAAKLGVALGLANLYLKRLVRKGFVKCVNVRSNRLLYLITPKGISEKTRLTYEFMEYSLWLYKEVRRHLSESLDPQIRSGAKRIALYGRGEAAELAYLSLKRHGLEPAAIFDGCGGGEFLGMPVRDIASDHGIAYDLLIVATLDDPQTDIDHLTRCGVAREQLVTMRQAEVGPN
jgi:DNA-binding MarR family transcriptional regulator